MVETPPPDASMPDRGFWSDKRVLLTGHTGFKGGWLSIWLARLGAAVTGIALPPDSEPDLFGLANIAGLVDSRIGDIRDAAWLRRQVAETRPQVVFHLAAQPLVREGYRSPLETFATNVMGTAHLLDALRDAPEARSVVVVTTDKVYRNNEWPYPYREADALGGHDPYSASKAAAELVTASYRDAFLAERGTAVASARAGNVIGGGDWAKDRLIPDAVRAWLNRRPLTIRRPRAVRPWQHVLDPLAGYLVLAERLWRDQDAAQAYNFGPDTGQAATVREVIELARRSMGQGDVIWDDSGEGPHEAGMLTLEIAKSRRELGVRPRLDLRAAVDLTMDWYRRQAEGEDARLLCEENIAAFEALA